MIFDTTPDACIRHIVSLFFSRRRFAARPANFFQRFLCRCHYCRHIASCCERRAAVFISTARRRIFTVSCQIQPAFGRSAPNRHALAAALYASPQPRLKRLPRRHDIDDALCRHCFGRAATFLFDASIYDISALASLFAILDIIHAHEGIISFDNIFLKLFLAQR